MAQILKLESQVEIQSSAEKIYEIFSSKPYLLPKICPNLVKDIQLVEGDWISTGSVREWTYNCAGSDEKGKETIKAFDHQNKSITYELVEGEFKKNYKSYSSTIQITKLGNGTSFAKFTVEYKKQNENVPPPTHYVDFGIAVLKEVDGYLLRA